MGDGPIVAAENLLNHHIRQSSAAQERLLALAGRSLAVQIQGLGLTLRLDAEETRVGIRMVTGEVAEIATATISGTPLTLLGLLRTSTAASFRASAAEVGGDTETAEAFAEVLRLARPELEEELSHLVGDVAAHAIGRSARRIAGWGERALAALTMNTSEFLQEEIRQLPPRLEVESFSREVERLRDDTDRAVQRVERLLEATKDRAAWDGSD